MRKNIFTISLLILFVLFLSNEKANSQDFYDLETVQTIKIYFEQNNWDYMMDTAKAGSEEYIMAYRVIINDTEYDSVGVKYKGNSTYRANQIKNPLHIELDTYKQQDYQGFKDIKLSNGDKDPSFVREVLSYRIIRKYMFAPRSNFATVYINDELFGLYVNSESISKTFVNSFFDSKSNPFFKCNPIGGAGPGGNSYPNLEYLDNDSSSYQYAYEMKSDHGWKELIELCYMLENNIYNIEDILDVDRALWMLAFDNVTVNLDSYIGGFTQNYYLYMDETGRFSSIIWDLNEGFGTFDQSGTISFRTTSEKAQMPHQLHVNDDNWSLVKNLLSIKKYKRMYIAHMKTILKENFENGEYMTNGNIMQNVIDDTYSNCPNNFFTYQQFKQNLTSDISIKMEPAGMGMPLAIGDFKQPPANRPPPPPPPNSAGIMPQGVLALEPAPPGGGKSAPGIQLLMDARTDYLLGLADFTYAQPTIENISLSTELPELNSEFYITANIADADTVYLAYRYDNYARFIRIPMLDDGNHEDGDADDNIYGASITALGSYVQYYIYAENSEAGVFSPERAEHEFHSVNINNYNPGESTVVINEVMASNDAVIADPQGDYDDWVELFNTGAEDVDLSVMYLSDKTDNLTKWQFPEGTILKSGEYLIIWADEDGKDEPGLHANFKLSASGELIMLVDTDENGNAILDSINFSEQATDISYGRYPNGTGTFKALSPTPGENNEAATHLEENLNNTEIKIYPNPVIDYMNLEIPSQSGPGSIFIEIINELGQTVRSYSSPNNSQIRLDFNNHPAGIYYLKIKTATGLIVRKFLKMK